MTDHPHGGEGHGDSAEVGTERLLLENAYARHGSRVLSLGLKIREIAETFEIEDWAALAECKEHSDFVAVLGEEKLRQIAQSAMFGEMFVMQAYSATSRQFTQDIQQVQRDVASIAEPTVPQQQHPLGFLFGGGAPPGM